MGEDRIQSLERYLRPPALRLLSRAGIWDYSQIEAMSDQELQSIDGMGPTRVSEIRSKIPYHIAEPLDPIPLTTLPLTHPGALEGIVDVQSCNGITASNLLRTGSGWELLGIYPNWHGVPARGGEPFHVLKSVTYAMGRRHRNDGGE